ncbi:MAG: hypothetical protein N5P05_002399 [Chroococcopsis gigantea SAG 12.99]|nr:hypothetical protein [Chlorogloea purpurea SAG 13.99]MDV3000793.1 hypothetical protein [Chroococcopsis gigantea SAG 12.99]
MTTATVTQHSFSAPFCPLPRFCDWVQLLQPLSDFGHNEALLLCQVSVSEWIAWVPDFGETILHENQFSYPSPY